MSPGDRVGRWSLVERLSLPRRVAWRCKCDCGSERIVGNSNLKSGRSLSCGCLSPPRLSARKHGATVGAHLTPEYRAWAKAKERCENPNIKNYRNYGGRGITMAPEWRSDFGAFLRAIGPRPPGTSIDRYPDNNGNYEPGNVRWANPSEQQQNRRTNRLITIGGETLCVAAWAERRGVPPDLIRGRLRLGWPPERAVLGRVA